MKTSSHAIIIGAGVAGIASAIRLAVQGMQVSVYEKNNYPGGKLSNFTLNGYHFDAGPSLFTQPQLIEELFSLAGEPIENYFSSDQLPINCRYFYEDGTILNAYADKKQFAKELSSKLGETESSLLTYLQKSKRIYNDIGYIFLNYSLHKVNTLFSGRIRKALLATRWSYLFRTMDQVNSAHFTNPKTVQLFNRYATYNGSNPYRAPGMLSLIPHLEYNDGAYYPKGGMIAITHALYQLALKKGVRFYFDSLVQRIIQNEGKALGVVVKGENKLADIIVSNMDVYFTYSQLMNDAIKAKKLLKQERSSSAFIFYWGIKKEFISLGLHNIFFSSDYKNEFEHIFNKKKIYDDPTVYINITSKCEPGLQAPIGKENWFVMVNAPANVGQDWNAYRLQYRKAIIEKLNRILQTDIESFIEEEEVLDPVLIESKTTSFMGSLYGTSSNSTMAAFLRHPNFSSKVKGLYFVGGSVHPGGGIPLCLQSAKIMSDIVMIDRKDKH